jgi:hypothetical protein
MCLPIAQSADSHVPSVGLDLGEDFRNGNFIISVFFSLIPERAAGSKEALFDDFNRPRRDYHSPLFSVPNPAAMNERRTKLISNYDNYIQIPKMNAIIIKKKRQRAWQCCDP